MVSDYSARTANTAAVASILAPVLRKFVGTVLTNHTAEQMSSAVHAELRDMAAPYVRWAVDPANLDEVKIHPDDVGVWTLWLDNQKF